MKKILSILAVAAILGISCGDSNNTPESEKYRNDDSGNHNRDGGYSPDTSTSGDTSSYQRMPNKTTDSTNQ